MSCIDILKKYKIRQNSLFNYFEVNGMSLRSVGESTILNYELGKLTPPVNTKYLTIEHRTWDHRKVILRSSYELHEALKLDNDRILYEVESLRIRYHDSIKKKNRIAIPDFYLPESNTIIEVKSSYTYDEQNMKDKIKEYKNKGYNFKLILDKEEIIDL